MCDKSTQTKEFRVLKVILAYTDEKLLSTLYLTIPYGDDIAKMLQMKKKH